MASGLANPDDPSREAGLLGDSRYDQVDGINHHWACINSDRKKPERGVNLKEGRDVILKTVTCISGDQEPLCERLWAFL